MNSSTKRLKRENYSQIIFQSKYSQFWLLFAENDSFLFGFDEQQTQVNVTPYSERDAVIFFQFAELDDFHSICVTQTYRARCNTTEHHKTTVLSGLKE